MRTLALIAGSVIGALLPGLDGVGLGVLLMAVAGLGLLCGRNGAALLLIVACMATRLLAVSVSQVQVPCDERLMAEALVTSIPARTPEGWQFDARVTHPRHGDRRALRLRLDFPRQGALRPRAGETWQLMLQYGPQGNAAHGRVMLRERLHARARVRSSPLNLRLAPAGISWLRVREHVATRIHDRVADPAAASLIAALAVGATGEVSDRQWRVFSATGISHLVAISGMHVTFFAMLSMIGARWIWARIAPLARAMRRDAFAAAAGVALAAAYALLSGFSVPAQRTLVMLIAFVVMRELARALRPCAALAWATVVVLAMDPLAVLDAGFWLSYVAVAALILMPGARVRQRGPLAGAVDVQWTVSLALLPLTLAIFGLFSVAGLVVNAVAIPVFTVLLVPAVLVATAGYLLPLHAAQRLADLLVDAAAWIVRPLWSALTQVADLPGAIVAAAPGPLVMLVAAGAVLLVLLPLVPAARLGAMAVLAWTFVAAQPPPTRHLLEVELLELGAETAVLLRTPAHALLVGTGETFGSRGRRFESVLRPRLRERLADGPEAWVLGRLNRDRLAAFTAASATLPALRGIGVAPTSSLPPEIQPCTGQRWEWDGVQFSVETLPSGRGCRVEVRAAERRVVVLIDATTGDRAAVENDERDSIDLLWPPQGANVDAGSARIAIDAVGAPRHIAAAPWWHRFRIAPERAICPAPD